MPKCTQCGTQTIIGCSHKLCPYGELWLSVVGNQNSNLSKKSKAKQKSKVEE